MNAYINDNGEFWDGGSVVIDGRRYLSPNEETLEMAGYHVYVAPEPTPEQLLALAKAEKIEEIEDYDNSTEVNEFFLAGQPMWLDAHTRQTLRISIDSYQSSGAETVTKWFNGYRYTFPTNAWISMLNALEIYAAEALNVTESHKSAVMAMESIEDVNAYDITSGYPEKLNLTAEWLRSR